MDVLSVYKTYFPDPPGGVQEAIRQICLSTCKFGVHNKIYSLSPKPETGEILRPEAIVNQSRSWFSPASCDLGGYSAISAFRDLVSKSDIIHYHFPWPFADILDAAVKPVLPKVLTYHSDIVRQKILGAAYAPLMWKMLKGVDVVIATSPAYANSSLILSDPAIIDKVRVVPLGIDESSYPKDGDLTILSRLGITESDQYFLFLGVLRYYKGLHILIECAKRVDSKIVIAGSGPELVKLKKLCEDNNVKNIIFTGHVTDSEKVALLKKCFAFVLPSHLRSEAYGMVLVEAAMMGKPMITCEISTGTSFVNLHGLTGLVVSPNNSLELSKAMQNLIADNNLSSKMGFAARLRYEQFFSSNALGKAYSSIYKELVDAS